MGRGLLERVAARRGLLGGSIWKLTVTAKKLLKVEDKGVNDYGTDTWDAGRKKLLPEQFEGGGGEDFDTDEGDFADSWGYHKQEDDWP